MHLYVFDCSSRGYGVNSTTAGGFVGSYNRLAKSSRRTLEPTRPSPTDRASKGLHAIAIWSVDLGLERAIVYCGLSMCFLPKIC